MLTVFVKRVDLGHSIDRNPVALFDGKRMIGGFQLDVRAYRVVAQMDARLQILGARIKRQFGASQPKNGPM